MEPHNHSSTANKTPKIEFLDPAPLRLHRLYSSLPAIPTDTPEWHGFVDALSATGPEGIPPIYVTAEGFIMDGARRWKAAKQLQWPEMGCVIRSEWEAPLLVVETLMGQRCLTKGAKVYLSLPILKEYADAAETRRLACLKKGVKILQKALKVPLACSAGSGKAATQLAEHLGVSTDTVEKAVRIRNIFELPQLKDHKFEFQDGRELTLREYFEPRLLDSNDPMGLGAVLKGFGEFVDAQGNPVDHPPADRNSHLFYFERAWQGWAKQSQRWAQMDDKERFRALDVVAAVAREVPDEVLEATIDKFRAEEKRRSKVEARKAERVPVGDQA